MLENVEEFKTWGPLNRRKHPIKSKQGKTFEKFVQQLTELGYEVQFRELISIQIRHKRQRGENSMSDIGGLDTVEETTEEKVVEMTEKKERKPFHYWTVNGRDYRLKLKASTINKLENKYRQNILNMLDDIPPLSVMLTIIQAAMEPWEHGLSYTKVQNLYDYWADEEGGNQTDLYSKIIIPTLAVSGFFTQEQADVLVEEMQNV